MHLSSSYVAKRLNKSSHSCLILSLLRRRDQSPQKYAVIIFLCISNSQKIKESKDLTSITTCHKMFLAQHTTITIIRTVHHATILPKPSLHRKGRHNLQDYPTMK
jgi:hypothetical protein